MKAFTNNGVRVKPELTDDWTIDINAYTVLTVSSEKLGLKIEVRTSLIPDFFKKIKKDGIQIIGNKVIGNYLVSSDLVLVSDQELALNETINWVEGGVYQEGTNSPFIYLGEFYVQKPSYVKAKLTSPKKVKIGVYDFSGSKYKIEGPEYFNYTYLEIKSNIIPTIKDKVDDYGKFIKDIDIKALSQGYLYIGRGLPSKKYTTVNKEAVLYGGHDAIEIKLNDKEYIVTTESFSKRGYRTFLLPMLNYVKDEKMGNLLTISRPKGQVVIFEKNNDKPSMITFMLNVFKRGYRTFLSPMSNYVKDEKMGNPLTIFRTKGQVVIFEKNNDKPLMITFMLNVDKDKNATINKETINVLNQQDSNISQDDLYNILLKTKNAEIRALKAI